MDASNSRAWRRWGGASALVASGLLAGGVLAGTLTANADDTSSSSSSATPSATSSSDATRPDAQSGERDESKSQRPDESLLTGDTASKVKAAALAKYPGATVLRVETDSDGVYEAHLTTADGQGVTVEVGKDFAVTGTEARPEGGGMRGGHGRHGGSGPRSADAGQGDGQTEPGSSTPQGENGTGGTNT